MLTAKRRQWRIAIEEDYNLEEKGLDFEKTERRLVRIILSKIEKEIIELCDSIIPHLEFFADMTQGKEAKAFYFKTIADY